MMNKGLEVIEAHHLFTMPAEPIDILIHPQSIVHSMVEYIDGSIMAQLSHHRHEVPHPVRVALPERVTAPFARLDLAKIRSLDFLEVDARRFPAVALGLRRLPRRRVDAGGAQRGQRSGGGALPGGRTSLHRDRRSGHPRAGEARPHPLPPSPQSATRSAGMGGPRSEARAIAVAVER